MATVRPAPGPRVAGRARRRGQRDQKGPVLNRELSWIEFNARVLHEAKDARRNLHDLPQVRLVGETVERALRQGALGERADVVVLDPPRTGAKKAVQGIVDLHPRRIVYVACDPAALARDLASFAARGYQLTGLRAFALFPMTHHVECVAVLERATSD